MGQKVHPIGFRIGITKQHQSQWFANFQKYQYAQSVVEDQFLRETIKKLFFELLNPTIKNKASAGQTKLRIPKISQIKIERSLLPYKIGIHIYAEKSLRSYIKKALTQLNLDPLTAGHVQKVRYYLLNLKEKQNMLPSGPASARITSKSVLAKNGSSMTMPEGGTIAATGSSITTMQTKDKGRTQSSKGGPGRASSRATSMNSKSRETRFAGKEKARSGQGPNLAVSQKQGSFTKEFSKSSNQRLKKRQMLRTQSSERMRLLSTRQLMISRAGYVMNIPKLNLISNLGTRPKLKGFNQSGPASINSLMPAQRGKSAAYGRSDIKGQKMKPNSFFGNKAGTGKPILKSLKTGLQKSLLTSAGKGLPGNSLKQANNLLLNKKVTTKRLRKKLVNNFFKRLNNIFLKTIRKNFQIFDQKLLQYKTDQREKFGSLRYAPLVYNKNWIALTSSSAGMQARNQGNTAVNLKKQPIHKLIALINSLHLKSQLKLENLRKEFLAFGTLSNSKCFGYYQIVKLISNLKDLVFKLKLNQRINRVRSNASNAQTMLSTGIGGTPAFSIKSSGLRLSSINKQDRVISVKKSKQLQKIRKKIDSASLKGLDLLEKAQLNKFKNIENSISKLKLSEYLKQSVIKHRQENIYYYLGTISEASKNLKKIQQFTKKYANFLFDSVVPLNMTTLGNTNSVSPTLGSGDKKSVVSSTLGLAQNDTHKDPAVAFGPEELNRLAQNLALTLSNSAQKKRSEKKLNEVFLDQIEKQKNRFTNNILLTPKISISFYSLTAKQIESKASFVADSIVDQLEKRKAFRKVIKDAQEDLMNRLGIKGVKIQVSGRLNGAEIARTEWVRAGRVPLQTLRANIDYSYKTANTIYGIIGVKVWIFKGLSDRI